MEHHPSAKGDLLKMRFRVNSKSFISLFWASLLVSGVTLGATNNDVDAYSYAYEEAQKTSELANYSCPEEEIASTSPKWIKWWDSITSQKLRQPQKLKIWGCIKPKINAMEKHFGIELNQFLFDGNFIYQNLSFAEAYLSSAGANNYEHMRSSQFKEVIHFLAAEDPSWYLYGGYGPIDKFLTKKEQLHYYESWLSTIGNDPTYLNDALPDLLLWGTSLGGTWANYNGHTQLQVKLANLLERLAKTRFKDDVVFQSEAADAIANTALMQGDFAKAKAIALANAMKALSNPQAFKNTQLTLEFWVSYFLGATTGAGAIHSRLGDHTTALRILDQALNIIKNDLQTPYPYGLNKKDVIYENLLWAEWVALKAEDFKSASRYNSERRSIYEEIPPPPVWAEYHSRMALQTYYHVQKGNFTAADKIIKQLFNLNKKLDWSIREGELGFVRLIANQAADLDRLDLKIRWMGLAAQYYLNDYKSRLYLDWPISTAEKTALTEFAFELIDITEISDDLKFEFFQAIQELQVNESGFRQRATNQTEAAKLSNVQKRLQDDEAYLSILNGESQTLIWIVTNKSEEVIRSPLSRDEVNLSVAQILRDIDRFSYTNKHLAAGRLSDQLIQVFLTKYPDAKSLYITPSRELSRLPFGVLPHKNTGEWLIETHAITHVPSPSFLLNEERGPSTLKKFFGIGAPLTGRNNKNTISYRDGSNELKPLWDAKIELEALGKMFSETVVLTGNNATEDQISNIQTLTPQIISIATHSVMTNDDLNPTLSLLLNPGEKSDGLVTPSEVGALDLSSTELIILSACNTANVNASGAQEAFTELAAEFIKAGAKNLILTYWPIESRTAMEISINTMKSTAPTYSEKLQDGIKFVMSQNPQVKKHPKYWGGMSVLGSN